MPEVDPWYDTFDPHSDWLPKETSQEDYTEDGCRALERKFWRELGLGEACWYGADMKGSLFTDLTTSWNVAHLPNLLNRLNLKRKLPGVNTPYLYWGMWAAAFAWHVEDVSPTCHVSVIHLIFFPLPRWTCTLSTTSTLELLNSGMPYLRKRPRHLNDTWQVISHPMHGNATSFYVTSLSPYRLTTWEGKEVDRTSWYRSRENSLSPFPKDITPGSTWVSTVQRVSISLSTIGSKWVDEPKYAGVKAKSE
jgi:hypothetical protein